jgi:manganese efflux pump family protein
MGLLTLVLIAVGLCMDTFAISISCGICVRKERWRFGFRVAFIFGLCQAVMPVLGWLAGMGLKNFISAVDHWIAFGLLLLIGGKMIHESFVLTEKTINPGKTRVLLVLALATSIDALAVGLSLGLLDVSILIPAVVIGCVTFVIAFLGVIAGHKAGAVIEKQAEVFGGLILIGIGVKILLEHLGMLK